MQEIGRGGTKEDLPVKQHYVRTMSVVTQLTVYLDRRLDQPALQYGTLPT